MFSHFEHERKLRLPQQILWLVCKEETMISKRAFKAKIEQLPQIKEEVDLKTYDISIFRSSIEHRYGDASSY